MCGTRYCGPCDNPIVLAWGRGEHHDMPRFGDQDQERVARTERAQVFATLFNRGDPSIFQWPEGQELIRIVGIEVLTIHGLMKELPLPTYLRHAPGKGASRKRKQNYDKALHKWHHQSFGPKYRAACRLLTLIANRGGACKTFVVVHAQTGLLHA